MGSPEGTLPLGLYVRWTLGSPLFSLMDFSLQVFPVNFQGIFKCHKIWLFVTPESQSRRESLELDVYFTLSRALVNTLLWDSSHNSDLLHFPGLSLPCLSKDAFDQKFPAFRLTAVGREHHSLRLQLNRFLSSDNCQRRKIFSRESHGFA